MSITQFDIGPGVICILKDTPDKQEIEIIIKGIFRHGGLSHDEIKSRLIKSFCEIDVDINLAFQSDEPGKEV